MTTAKQIREEETAYEEAMTSEDYYAENIWAALRASRNEPGVSLQNIAAICGSVFSKEELGALINNLKEELCQKKK